MNRRTWTPTCLAIAAVILIQMGWASINAATPPDAGAPNRSVIISEFLAANVAGLRDEDGDSSDWIELFNTTASPVNLAGWFLTDDPQNLAKWEMPSFTLPAGAYTVIFASGKDRSIPPAPLHTNFRLAQSGEYLGLVDASMRVVSQFAPAYPPQQPNISYGRDPGYPATTNFYADPTPGAPNSSDASSGSGVPAAVEFSSVSGTFVNPFTLALSTPQADAEIRYEIVQNATTATNVPNATSPLYSGPLSITNSVIVRARAFASGELAGPIRSESFIQLQTNVLGFSSDLPVMILHTFGLRPEINGHLNSNHSPAFLVVFEPRAGRTALTNRPTTTTRVGINVHGGSTGGQPKASFNLEGWDESDQDKDFELLGMPAESDWLLHSTDMFEPAQINHSFINELSQRAGRYAPRTRMVEVFLSTNAPGQGSIGAAQYNGIYAVMEKIKRSPARVNIDRLDPQDVSGPAVTGGYLMKTERIEPHEGVLNIPTVGPVQGGYVVYQNPEFLDIRRPEREPQRRYLENYLLTLATNLASPAWTNELTGYTQYLDRDSWVDLHILNVLAFNVDAFRLGGFWSKPRDQVNERGEVAVSGRLQAGPIYDFDRAFGSTDGRDFNPRVWRSTVGDLGTDFFHYWWYDRLFRDSDFWQRWIDRWQELRQSAFRLDQMTRLIDSLHDELREAQPRELARWGGGLQPMRPRSGIVTIGGFTYDFGSNGFAGEIAFFKHWISNRVDFIDTNFVNRPLLSVTDDSGSSYTVELQIPGPIATGTTIYYTLNGTDPRLPGGGIRPGALVYTGAIHVTANARVIGRAYNANHRNVVGPNAPPLSSPWSGPVAQTFVVIAPTLRITELMYQPANSDPGRPLQFEYVELRNVGGPLNLAGFRLRGAIEFTFPALTLNNGEHVLVVGDRDGFTSRYGTTALVAGQYQTALGNESGHLVLEGPLGEIIHDFTYRRDWFPITAGHGFSLVIQNEYQPLREQEEGEIVDNWDQLNNWRPSAAVGGTPGSAEPLPSVIAPILVNEILPRPTAEQTGFIELLNQSGPDTFLSGWYLTDDFNAPKKFRIPDGTTLPVGTYVVFEESQFNAPPGTTHGFALNPKGGEVFLFSADSAGNLTGGVQGFRYGPTPLGVTIGRYLSFGGGEQFVAQTAPSPGLPNPGPRVGPVVITEIQYHPIDFVGPAGRTDNTEEEFIEIKNITNEAVALFEPGRPESSWRIGGGTHFSFPPNTVLPAHAFAVIVAFDPVRDPARQEAFRAKYSVPAAVPIYGPLSGALNNSGALVEVQTPQRLIYSATRSEVVYAREDHVIYAANEAWPAAADGIGPSLNRFIETEFGNDPLIWTAATPTPGASYQTGERPAITRGPQSQTAVTYQTVTFDVIAEGPAPLSYQWRFNDVPIPGATSAMLVLPDVDPSQAGSYDVVVMNPFGAVTSAHAQLSLLTPLLFTLQPQSQILRPGGLARFEVAVDSLAPPVRYQWFKNGTAIPNATNSTYTIASVTASDRGDYYCAVTDRNSTRNSATARLTVLVSPVIVQSPVSQTLVPGGAVVFSVQVSNTASLPLGFRWRRAGQTVSFQQLNSFTSYLVVTNTLISPVIYTVVVTNEALITPGVISSNAVLTVVADTDGDGLPDEFELAQGLDPNNPSDARLDSDGDDMTNLNEYTAGTAPRDPLSYLKVDRISVAGGVRLEFTAAANKTYQVQSRGSLGPGQWEAIASIVAQTNSHPVSIVDPLPGTNRFYRLVTPAYP